MKQNWEFVTRGRQFWLLSPRADLALLKTDDGSNTLMRTDSADTFHSVSGAVSETRHTYLTNSGIQNGWGRKNCLRVLEFGFGTGLGLYLTADEALRQQKQLEFVSIENDFLGASTLVHLEYESALEFPGIVKEFLQFRASLGENCIKAGEKPQAFRWSPREFPNIQAAIHVTSFQDWLDASAETTDLFDVVYFDPFCRSSTPEIWMPSVFRSLASLLCKDGRIATYSCARAVRDAIASSGLIPKRVPGPPKGKRESLVAEWPAEPI